MTPNLRARLLPFTIDNARAKPFYAGHWAGSDVDAVTDLSSLPALPTVSKEQYRNGFMFDFEDPGDSHYVSHSTGTTGVLTWRHRSLSEAATAEHLFGAVRRRTRGGAPRVAIVLSTQFHGMPFPVPAGDMAVPAPFYGDQELLHCIEMLQTAYRVHGYEVTPTAVMGQGEDIALLAQALRERDVDPGALGIEAIHAGDYIDTGMRAFIESAFGASISGRYSLSEILGGANHDPGLDAYRLDPYVIGEVLDEAGEQLPPGGVGELTLTELFPLVQMQPLIRYRTGDIVQRVDAGDDLAFNWWGRRHETVATGAGAERRWLFGYRQISDLLATEPSVERLPVRPGLTVVRTTRVGNLHFEVTRSGEAAPLGFGLKVWLRYVPELHPDALQDMQARLKQRLGALCGDPLQHMRLEFDHDRGAS